MEQMIGPLYYEGLEEAFGPFWKTIACSSLFRLVHKTEIIMHLEIPVYEEGLSNTPFPIIEKE